MKNMNLNTGFDANNGKRLVFFSAEAPEPGQNAERADKIDVDKLFESEFAGNAEMQAAKDAEEAEKLGSLSFDQLKGDKLKRYYELKNGKSGMASETTPDPELDGRELRPEGFEPDKGHEQASYHTNDNAVEGGYTSTPDEKRAQDKEALDKVDRDYIQGGYAPEIKDKQ